jgi:hypothetical protein
VSASRFRGVQVGGGNYDDLDYNDLVGAMTVARSELAQSLHIKPVRRGPSLCDHYYDGPDARRILAKVMARHRGTAGPLLIRALQLLDRVGCSRSITDVAVCVEMAFCENRNLYGNNKDTAVADDSFIIDMKEQQERAVEADYAKQMKDGVARARMNAKNDAKSATGATTDGP